jgi:predicted RNase H-like HicB family nuclease
MTFDDYKVVLYRNQPDGWVAEIPAIPGSYALMMTREAALVELERVFDMIATEYHERGLSLPVDSTEIARQRPLFVELD